MDLQGLLNYVNDQTKNDWNDESPPNYEFGDPLYSLASAINHPVHAIPHLLDFINRNVKTAADPFSSDEDKVEAGFNLAGGAQTGAFPFASSGVLGTIVKPRVLQEMIKHYGGPAGIIKKTFYEADKVTPKYHLIGDDAVDYYLDAIKGLKSDKNLRQFGIDKTFYENPKDTSQFYASDLRTPDVKIHSSYGGKQKGQGNFNDILTGIFLDNGMKQPSSITRMAIANPETIKQVAAGVPLNQTFLGHSTDRIASNLGGQAKNYRVLPSDFTDDLRTALDNNVNLSNYSDLLKYFNKLPLDEKPYNLERMLSGFNLGADVDYPGLLNRPK